MIYFIILVAIVALAWGMALHFASRTDQRRNPLRRLDFELYKKRELNQRGLAGRT